MGQHNPLNLIEKIAYLELFVGNIFQAKSFFINSMKFEHIAVKKEEHTIKYLLKQGDIHLVLVSSLTQTNSVVDHLVDFGDSIKKISFWVHDVDACFNNSIAGEAVSVLTPQKKEGVYTASVMVFNELEHEFLQISSVQKIPGFEYNERVVEQNTMLFEIDHIALCHPSNTIQRWVRFYQEAFSFSENKNEDIYSEESGMHIIIMKSPNGRVKLPLVEPSAEKSPLNTYLKYNHGAGVHHVAFATDDIVATVKHYEQHSGELRKAPPSYYVEAKESYPLQIENIDRLAPYGIMLEQDDKGILFQIFTKPVVSRPTLFLEFVQRDVCEGFGTVNIKALYETLEA